MAIRVFIAEDHQVMVDGLMTLLGRQGDFELVGSACMGTEIINSIQEIRPDIVLMDISMPGISGIDVTRQIAERFERVRVIAFSMHSEQKYIVEMLRAGAWGYVIKKNAFDELARAIRTVFSGMKYLSPEVAAEIVDEDYQNGEISASVFSILSNREREVLQLLAQGRTTRKAAKELHISPKTVESHRANIMGKLKIDNIADLTRYAVREGIVSVD